MIIDKISSFEKYKNVHERLDLVAKSIERFSDPEMVAGKYPIDGDHVFAVVQEYDSKIPAEDMFENHRKYIDVQYIVAGKEEIHVKDMENLEISQHFDVDKDYEFYKTPNVYVNAQLEAGEFALFFPGETHRPGCAVDGKIEKIHKVIFKVEA